MSELNAPMPGDSKSKSDPFPDPPVRSGPGLRESVALMALMVSLVALSIDGILPALPAIGRDLGVERGNANQLIITMLFLGMAIGQIFYGPLSDSTGRKPAIYLGFFFFFTGSLLCLLATSFQVMLAGRALQGIGAAGPRAVTTALIRDQYEGRAMARVNSFVLAVFILVPIFAPALGQGILMLTHWRGIFGLFLMLAAVAATWFHFRQPETLSPTQRIPFSPKKILSAVGAVFASRVAVGYSLAMGFVYGSFIGYLSSTQQIFQIQYGLGARFPLVFAIFALSIGTASLCNGRLVLRIGMRPLSTRSLQTLTSLSTAFWLIAFAQGGHPPLWSLMAYMIIAFLCIGVLFGNLPALAMEPLGHIAGTGSAVVMTLSTFLSLLLGTFIGQSYNNTILPLIGGFAVLSGASLLMMLWVDRAGARSSTNDINKIS